MSAWQPLALVLLQLAPLGACAGTSPQPTLTVQWYPVGFITRAEFHTAVGEHGDFTSGVGWNQFDRGDNGEHADEEGGGPGLLFGYRHYLQSRSEGFFLSGHLDFWWLEVDWVDLFPLRQGTTDATVMQPYVGGGYRFPLGEAAVLELAAGVGAEINISTDGEDVGEGAILLLGLSLLF